MTLLDAAYALHELASARTPNTARLVSGANALNSLKAYADDSRWQRAAAELRFMAAVGPLNLSVNAREQFRAMSVYLQDMAREP